SRSGEGIEQSRLAGIGISGQGYQIEALLSPPLPAVLSLVLSGSELGPDLGHSSPDIMIHGFFIGPCSAKARLLSPLFQSQGISDLGGIVAEPGQFHLQLGLPGRGAGGEYLQDEVKPVQHSNSKLASDVVDLAWAERIIEDEPEWVVA